MQEKRIFLPLSFSKHCAAREQKLPGGGRPKAPGTLPVLPRPKGRGFFTLCKGEPGCAGLPFA